MSVSPRSLNSSASDAPTSPAPIITILRTCAALLRVNTELRIVQRSALYATNHIF